ncbi:MAG: biotin--[acetyl-CoA-carboxylase] ligase [Clostridia bacterium]|nr:biotin--[acetyl-CoA-carboxylase] ligase [Clostridia bacterium]
MNTKDKVLSILYGNEAYVSGEYIATQLGISRNSVWKAVNQLREGGYSITAGSEGYLLERTGAFDEHAIRRYLKRKHKLYIYNEEGSSNTVAKSLCAQGEGEGTVVIVKSQTEGRGRLGRTFLSSSENGLYMTIILRPKIPVQKCVNITVAGAVAVADAIEKTSGVKSGIKWVNDIYINDKKCAGILTEASIDFECGGVQYAVIGIGVNLCPPVGGFDPEIKEIACGVYEKEYPQGYKARLCGEIINEFFDIYEYIEGKEYLKAYKEKSIIIGKAVDVYVGDKIVYGTVIDIDEDANLVVKDDSGKIHTFNSGEARVRKTNDKRGV